MGEGLLRVVMAFYRPEGDPGTVIPLVLRLRALGRLCRLFEEVLDCWGSRRCLPAAVSVRQSSTIAPPGFPSEVFV